MVVAAWQARPDKSSPAARALRSDLMRHWVDAEVVRLLQLRSGVLRAHGSSGAEASLGKLAVSTTGRRLAEWAPALLGPAGGLLEEGYTPAAGRRRTAGSVVQACIASPGMAIAGGTDQIQRNIIGERVLGLPPEPAAYRPRATEPQLNPPVRPPPAPTTGCADYLTGASNLWEPARRCHSLTKQTPATWPWSRSWPLSTP
jgi:hypothetical protein